MSLDFATYSKIYDAVTIKNKSFDRVEVSKILVEFMRDTYQISSDRYRNPGFFLPSYYFREFIDNRYATISYLEKFTTELHEQIEKLEIAYQNVVNEELRVNEEEIKKKIEKKERKLWNTQKLTPCGKDKGGISKKVRKPLKSTKKEGKASSSETTPDQSLETSNTGT